MTAETTSARAELVAKLAADLPNFRVMGYRRGLDTIDQPTVLAYAADMNRGLTKDRTLVTVTYSIWVLSGLEDAELVDDELDTSMDSVLDVLAGVSWLDWTTAERGVFDDTWHGWRLTLTAIAHLVPTPTEEP